MFHLQLDQTQRDEFESYLGAWFCKRLTLAPMCGVSMAQLNDMLDAGVCPGVVYRTAPSGHVWSALSAYMGHLHDEGKVSSVEEWLTPAAVSWIRRAKLTGINNPSQIAAQFQRDFARDFERGLETIIPSLVPYRDKIHDAAHAWDAWVRGAYAVCMRSFSAELVIEKLTRRLRARELLDIGTASLSPHECQILLTDITRLSEILTPFSPFERPAGTPGTVIDRGLSELGLGVDNPFNVQPPAPVLEAC